MNLIDPHFHRIFGCFVALLILDAVQGSAVSAQTVLERLEQQIRRRVNPSQEPVYLGVVADDRKDRGRGVRITDVRPGSPAERAGFRKQDLVTSLAGIRVRQLTDMTEILGIYHADDTVEFDIIRDGTPEQLKVTLGRRPAAPAPASQTAEVIPLPPGESILPEPPPAQITPPTVNSNSPVDREIIEQLQNRIVELERRVAELERALSESQKNK